MSRGHEMGWVMGHGDSTQARGSSQGGTERGGLGRVLLDSPGETLFPQGLDGHARDVHRHQAERELLEGSGVGQRPLSLCFVMRGGWYLGADAVSPVAGPPLEDEAEAETASSIPEAHLRSLPQSPRS